MGPLGEAPRPAVAANPLFGGGGAPNRNRPRASIFDNDDSPVVAGPPLGAAVLAPSAGDTLLSSSAKVQDKPSLPPLLAAAPPGSPADAAVVSPRRSVGLAALLGDNDGDGDGDGDGFKPLLPGLPLSGRAPPRGLFDD